MIQVKAEGATASPPVSSMAPGSFRSEVCGRLLRDLAEVALARDLRRKPDARQRATCRPVLGVVAERLEGSAQDAGAPGDVGSEEPEAAKDERRRGLHVRQVLEVRPRQAQVAALQGLEANVR